MIDNKGYIGNLNRILSTLCLKVFHIHLIPFLKRHMLLGQYEQHFHSFFKKWKKIHLIWKQSVLNLEL